MAFQYVSQYVQEELSESDCPSEGQHLTELYRRKHAARSRYYHVPGYYEHQSRPCPCSYAVPPEPARCYYYRNAAAPSSRSSTRLSPPPPPPPRTCHDTKSTTTAAGKKYPVTARTPRYYRCPVAPLCKRPSTLCLPVTCQPDPAAAATAVQRVRKPEVQRYVKGQQEECEYKTKEPRPVDSEGDVNSRLNDLENLLTKFDEDGGDDDDDEAVELSSVKDLSKILKPKVPPSMKEKIVKLRAVKPAETPKTLSQPINELQVKEVPADEPLDLLLQHLSKENEEDVKKTTREEEKKGEERKMASFPEARTRRFVSGHVASKPSPLDDNSALELHKSKSYIVSLIDKALSRELGTIPGDKCSRKEFLNMSPKKAVDLVNRHAMVPKTCNRLVSVDVAQASSARKDGNLECRNVSEEPLYLKQLKQLRWSHLRHIQREAKRLADLERFLDSFGEIDSGP